MPQSQSRTRARILRAGLTAGALGGALLVAPTAAHAAPNVGPSIVTLGGNATISDPAANYGANAIVQLSTTACSATTKLPATGASGPWNPTVVNKNATSITFTVPASGGPATGLNGTAKSYFACVYDGNVANNSNPLGGSTIYLGTPVAVNPPIGLTGGGNQLTATTGPNSPLFTGVTAVAAVFATGPCNTTLGAATVPGLTATNVVRLPNNSGVSLTVPAGVVASTGGAPTMYNLCLYDGSSANGALLSFANYGATVVGVSPASGSYLTSNGVTASSTMPFLTGITAPAVLVLPMTAGCPGTYSAAQVGGVTPLALNAPSSVRRLTNNRAAVTLPPLQLLPPGQPTTYQLCFYGGITGSAALLGTGTYTAGVIANPTGVVPAAGPPSGGNTITVVGTDLPTDPGRITATLGGIPLTNIQAISDKAFTAQVPAHAAEDGVSLVVSTPTGTRVLPGAYSYLATIKVSPNTAPSMAPSVDVDVQGSGFMSLNFGSGGNAGRVFLVDGVYNGADAGGGVRANGPVAECVSVLPISDEELVCTLQLNRRLNALGTGFFDSVGYNNTIANDLSTVAGSMVVTSTAGNFEPGDVGQPIVQTGNANIPPNTLVTSVLSAAKAVISKPSPLTGSTLSATIGNNLPAHSLAAALTTTNGSNNVTAPPGAFTRADIGRVLNNVPGFTNGTTVTAVAPGGASATLSAAATASTQYAVTAASIAGGSSTLTSTALLSTDVGAVIGANSLGIPVGTTITAVVPNTSATLSAPAVGGGGPADLSVNKPVNGNFYAAAPVLDGSYNLVVVSDGAPDAATTDPDYFQTDVTSGSTFTVAPF